MPAFVPSPPSPTQSGIQTALRSFLLSCVPAGVEVIEGQDSRVPEPQGTDFIIMTPIFRRRLETVLTVYADVAYEGTIAGEIMTVTSIHNGVIVAPAPLFGVGVAAGSQITGLGSGTGADGTYSVSPAQTIATPTLLASGVALLVAPVDLVYQLDFHSANVTDSADMAQTVMTVFRSDYAVMAFEQSGTGASPLYADEARQAPFQNAERQYESRWTLDVHIQADQTVPWPLQFTNTVAITIKPPADAYVP